MTNLIDIETGMACMAILPLLGPTPVAIDYFATRANLKRRHAKHALETLVVLGKASVETTVAHGKLYSAKPGDRPRS